MTEGFHPPAEEYLEAIHDLEEDNITVIQARLADRLGHAAPTVHENIRRLRDSGYIEINDRTVSLTRLGREKAQKVVRKHRLAERLLTDVIGLAWHKAHKEAALWEHVISDEVAERLEVVLGNPTTCPHGNPIPGAKNPASLIASPITMSKLARGESFTLVRVPEQVEFNDEALALLGEAGFITGTYAIFRGHNDGNYLVSLSDRQLAIPAPVAELLYVERGKL